MVQSLYSGSKVLGSNPDTTTYELRAGLAFWVCDKCPGQSPALRRAAYLVKSSTATVLKFLIILSWNMFCWVWWDNEHACEQRKYAHVHDPHSLLPHLHIAFRKLCSFRDVFNLYSESCWTLRHCESTKLCAHISYQHIYSWTSGYWQPQPGRVFLSTGTYFEHRKKTVAFQETQTNKETYHIVSYWHYFPVLANHLCWKSRHMRKGKR